MKRNLRNNRRGARYEVRDTNKNLVPRNSYLVIRTSYLVPRNSYLVILFVFALAAACSNKEEAHEHDTYTCPMHPTVISDRPGSCPVCGMDLVRKARAGEEIKITEDLAKLLKSPNETVVASIR